MRRIALAALAAAVAVVAASAAGTAASPVEFRSLDGGGNNLAHPTWGEANTPYIRIAPANYDDGIGSMAPARSPRYISNRVFNDTFQTLFSENDVSQIAWMWGQFIDHTLDLQNENAGDEADIAFSANDPLETFANDTGAIQFFRTPVAPGTGTSTSNPRQHVNTVNSFIDGWNIYGGSTSRIEWLRDGKLDGNLANNDAQMVLVNGYLPRADARGSAATAPSMDLMGPLVGNPQNAIVAGDVRANENIALTALTTLFVREHNRIASLVPQSLPEQTRFDIARRVVGAEEQYITYREFLPAMGVRLPAYRGYDSTVNPSIANEFATVAFRGHSGVNGELQAIAPNGFWSAGRLQQFANQGIEVEALPDGQNTQLTVSMTLAFGAPGLLPKLGLGPLFRGVAANPGYRNDELIDNKFRSILFQVPAPGTDPATCVGDVTPPGCFSDVQDLGAIDVQRDRDHGIPTYNQLRAAVGLPAVTSYTGITGESTSSFPSDVNRGNPLRDPKILRFDKLFDINGNPLTPGTAAAAEDAVTGIRHSTLAARLRALYGDGNIDSVDAFVGMVSEPHAAGSELGPLQTALWTTQFQALRDGDRFFYLNDPYLTTLRQQYGIDYRHTLAQLIKLDAGVTVQPDAFHVSNG